MSIVKVIKTEYYDNSTERNDKKAKYESMPFVKILEHGSDEDGFYLKYEVNGVIKLTND